MEIGAVQTVRKAVLALGIAIGTGIFAVTDSVYPSGGAAHELIEWAGIVAIVVCILGRTWSSLYIGGRKIDQLVTVGPYSVMRNPLYTFSVLGAGGVGAQAGSVTLALIFAALAHIVFSIVVRQEEALLASRHGAQFADYRTRVPGFWPNWSLWHDEPVLSIQPTRVLLTFGDALAFLLSVPIAEGFEYLREQGALPVLWTLP